MNWTINRFANKSVGNKRVPLKPRGISNFKRNLQENLTRVFTSLCIRNRT